MRRFFLFALCLLSPLAYGKEISAKDTLESFYRKYFASMAKENNKRPALPLSSSFQKLVKENKRLCRKFAPDEVCGYGADGDIYLDAQDYDDDLTFEAAKAKIAAEGELKARIDFLLFPDEKDPKKQGARTLIFTFKKEGGRLVVDDIQGSDGRSARALIQEEIDYLKKPQPKEVAPTKP